MTKIKVNRASRNEDLKKKGLRHPTHSGMVEGLACRNEDLKKKGLRPPASFTVSQQERVETKTSKRRDCDLSP